MSLYAIFGGCLDSDVLFPQLRPCSDRSSRWTLRTVGSPPRQEPKGVVLGEADVDHNVKVRLIGIGGRYRLTYDDTGIFDVSADGREIVWSPAEGAAVEAARLDVMGRVMAVALHAAGVLCLHGSAVATRSGAVGFLGPKFHGKSSLATAMIDAGATLLTDDTLPVRIEGGRAHAHPGVHAIRLWHDAAERFRGRVGGSDDADEAKHTFSDLPAERLMVEDAPLRTVYLLQPVKPAAERPPVQRFALDPVRAAVSLVGHSKLGALLGKSETPSVLDRAVAIARVAPVYRLEVVRDFDLLPTVAEQLLAWARSDASEGARSPSAP